MKRLLVKAKSRPKNGYPKELLHLVFIDCEVGDLVEIYNKTWEAAEKYSGRKIEELEILEIDGKPFEINFN